MTIRIDTTLESGETAAWSPAANFVIQGQSVADSNAVIEYQARLDPAAPWAAIETFRPAYRGMMLCRKLFSVRLIWSRYTAGDTLKGWTVE